MTARALARDAANEVADRLGAVVRDELQHRRKHPCATAAYMREMLKQCRRFMRPWYRFQTRRWNAKCNASGHAKACGMEE